MGIKHFWNWFNRNFGRNIKKLKKLQTFETANVSVDNLMIDLNGLFHSSAQKIYEYGNHKPRARFLGKQNHKTSNSLKTQIKMFSDICSTIEHLFTLVKPTKRLILCVDGPAPLSKQNQQRQRRFRSVNEKDENEMKRFDSNCITPGTKFMDYLTKYIDWYIKKNISENPAWSNIEVIFSDEKAPGEGEHKIINYIRLYGDPKDSFCIHGLDADLIMLSLGTHLPNFWVLREDMYSSDNNFFLIDIGKVRTDLSKLMDWNSKDEEYDTCEKDKKEFVSEYAVNDFIFLCFMVGNDFLPHIPSLEIIEGGIDQMLDVYRDVCKSTGHITTKVDGDIIFINNSLDIFFSTIGKYDKEILEDKLMKKDKFFPDNLLEQNSTFVDQKYVLNIEKYREDYYKDGFSVNMNMRSICHQYLVGLQWVLSYYTKGVPDWKWCYQYHYAPFAHELSLHIKDFKLPEKKLTSPATPFQQLLSVLPPKSSELIPTPLCRLLTDSNSKIHKFCPSEFAVDIRGKRQEWEGIVLLPMVNFDIIKEEYRKNIDKVFPRDLKLDTLGRSIVYSYCKDESNIFKSYYGNIESCKVNCKIIDL